MCSLTRLDLFLFSPVVCAHWPVRPVSIKACGSDSLTNLDLCEPVWPSYLLNYLCSLSTLDLFLLRPVCVHWPVWTCFDWFQWFVLTDQLDLFLFRPVVFTHWPVQTCFYLFLWFLLTEQVRPVSIYSFGFYSLSRLDLFVFIPVVCVPWPVRPVSI